jgi:tripeptidyl-peptidase-1
MLSTKHVRKLVSTTKCDSSTANRINSRCQGPRWVKGERVPAAKHLPVRIGLTQSNLHRAEEYLLDVSHPKSPNYGKLWTSDEVIKTFQPSETAVQAVRDWLAFHGIVNVAHSDNKAWLAFDAPASKVEALLHTEYFEHEDQVTGGILPACDKYHVPKTIQEHIDYITPGTKLMAPVRSDTEMRLKREARNDRRGE